MKKILVYGSLRKGEYNYKRFLKYYPDGLNYLATTTITGYKLYDLGSYPGIRPQDGTELVVDVMEVSDEAYDSITGMERGAGYSVVKETVEGFGECTIYVYDYPVNEKYLVESGDWSKYLSHQVTAEA